MKSDKKFFVFKQFAFLEHTLALDLGMVHTTSALLLYSEYRSCVVEAWSFVSSLQHGGDKIHASLQYVYICNSFSMRSVHTCLLSLQYMLKFDRQKERAFIIFTEMKGVGSWAS